jgi:hypothetical protein
MNTVRNAPTVKRLGALAMFAGLAVTASACGSTYDRQEALDELVNVQGLDDATASCIVDGMEDKIGVDRLGDRGNPTAEEEQIIIDITTDCLLGG